MSCGHCRLKITSELQSAGYDIKEINMDTNTITLNADIKSFPKIVRILDKINYIIESNCLPESIEKRQIKNKKVEDDKVLNSIFEKLSELHIVNYDFDFNEDILQMKCTEDEFDKIKQVIDSIEIDV